MEKKDIGKFLDNLYYNLNPLEYKVLMKYGFVAGGAIRSLLTDTKINDIDIYFPHIALSHFMSQNKYIYKRRIVTKNAVTFTKQISLNYKPNAGSCRVNLQFIFKFADTPDNVISQFDFTNSMGYYRFSDKKLYIAPEMLESINKKKLVFNTKCNSTPFAIIKRAKKFSSQGYQISLASYGKMLYKILNADVKSFFEKNTTDGY